MIYRLLRNEEKFIQELKVYGQQLSWKNSVRSAALDFKIEMVQADFSIQQ